MGFFSELRSRARYVIGPVMGMSVLAYFSYHVVHGERGLFAWMQFKERIVAAKSVLTDIQVERKILENRVRLLHPDSLDPDMLEERARVMIGYGHTDEIVIIEDNTKE